MYSPQNYIEKPINLLHFDSLGHAILNAKAVEFIKSIPKPISIMSITGPYRTGKSYLLNSIISGEECFPTSSTTSSCTKGLWVWGKPLTSVDQQGKITNVLVIDTEGFGCLDQSYDKRILILALLLSTCFIYNSKGNIDKSSIKDLQYVIEQTKKIKRQLCFDSVTDFHWVLRDFHLQIVNELQLQISPNQYMQKWLKQYSDQNQQQKQTYKLMCNFFRNRNCHIFASPQTDSKVEQNPQFLQQLIKFKKILNGIPSLELDGSSLSQILQAYVSAMNQDQGVQAQGVECRLRLNCMSQLCQQLKNIIKEQQAEKRAKMVRLALHQVEDSFISKMTSQKQISLLKEDINMLLSEYQETSAPSTSKHIKVKQTKSAIHVIKSREPRASIMTEQMESEKQIKSTYKLQLLATQRCREQLEAKIYRSQLFISQLNQDVKRLTNQNRRLQQSQKQLQEEVSQLRDELFSKDKSHALQKFDLIEQIQSLRKQKLIVCSELQKQKQLLNEKICFLQQRFANLQIQQMESSSGLVRKYTQKIQYLQRENMQMNKKHEKEIEELKQIYMLGRKQEKQEKKNQVLSDKKIAMGEQIKTYLQQISNLIQQNSILLIGKTKLQNQNIELRNNYEQSKTNLSIEIQSLQKELKEATNNLTQKFNSQLLLKEKIIKQYQSKLIEQTQNFKLELEQITKKNQQQTNYANSVIQNLQNQLEKNEQQLISVCEQLQISEKTKNEKQKQIKQIITKLEQQRQSNSSKYNENFENVNLLRSTILTQQQIIQKLQKQIQSEKNSQQKLSQQLQQTRRHNCQHNQQRKSMYEMQITRLEQKIAALNSNNSALKSIQNQYQELKNKLRQEQQQKQELTQIIEDKQRTIRNMQVQQAGHRQENGKLEKIILQLTNMISKNQSQFQNITKENNQKLQQKQSKYLELLQKYHSKGEIEKADMKLNDYENKIKQLQQQKQELQRTVRIFSNDARETCTSLTAMRKNYDKHCQQYEAAIKIMRNRVKQLQQCNEDLRTKLEKSEHQLQYIEKNKRLLQLNYHEDFKLWNNKINRFQQRVDIINN